MGKKIRSIKINKRLICASTSSYVVAEISGNHNGNIRKHETLNDN